MTNLIKNGEFNEGYGTHDAHRYKTDGTLEKIEVGEISNPKEWTTFFVHGSPVPWDEDNLVGFAQPEVRLETSVPDPNRVMEGTTHSLHGFGFYRIIDCGHFQIATGLTPGQTYILRGFTHAWSNKGEDENPRASEGVGETAYAAPAGDTSPEIANHTFRFGVNLDGDTNINNATWGTGWNIYNKFHELTPLVFEATGTKAVVFLRDTVLWPYMHNDYYWSSISLSEEVEEPTSPSEPPNTDYDYPVIETGSKLCDHAVDDSGMIDAIYDRMQRGVFTPVAKSVAMVGALKAVKLMSPDTITIGRFLEGVDDDIDEEGPPLDGDLRETAEKVMNSYMPRWAPHKAYVDYWEVVNEQDPPGVAGHLKLAEFYTHCMDIAEANGYKLAILSYSLGVPEYDEMKALVDSGVFARAKAGGHILSLHEYASPTNKWFGQPIPGAEQRDDAGPLCTRYRFLYSLLEEAGQVIPLVITEFNTTEAVKSYTAEDWIANMAWYDERMAEDYYVLGANIFTLATGVWESFIYIDYIKDLENYMVSVIDRENALPPTVEPSEPPAVECPAPRVPYSRVYVLVPPNYGFEWMAACSETWDAYRWTWGGSADDAGHGPGLASVTVIALNPHEWPGDLEAFYDEFYDITSLHEIYADDPQDFAEQVWIYYNGEEELKLDYPTTHMPPLVTSGYGDTYNRVYPHNGIDLRSSWNAWQDQIVCAISGTVTFVGISAAYGNHIITRSNVGGKVVDVRYAHLEYDGEYVSEGELVKRGQYLGKPDNTGSSTGDHLHFDVKIDGVQVDPTNLIDWPGGYVPPGGGSPTVELRGAHAAPITSQLEGSDAIVNKLTSLGMKWFKLLSDGNPNNIELCRKLVDAGITPIIRLYASEQFPNGIHDAFAGHIGDLVGVGVEYFEVGNEPNIPNEWKTPYKDVVDFHDDDIIRMCAESFVADARGVLLQGGKPGIYAMAPTDVNDENPQYSSVQWLIRLCDKIARIAPDLRQELESGNIWLSVHSATFTRPFEFDPFANNDDMCLRSYELYSSIVKEHLGVDRIDVISTEGGIFSPEQMDYIGWHDYDYDELTWGDRVVEMYHFLEDKGELMAMCPWTFSDYGVHDTTWHGSGWYRVNNEPRSPITALLEDIN